MAGTIECRYIAAGRLKQLLSEVPDDWIVWIARTENLGFGPEQDGGRPSGHISLLFEEIDRYDGDEEDGEGA